MDDKLLLVISYVNDKQNDVIQAKSLNYRSFRGPSCAIFVLNEGFGAKEEGGSIMAKCATAKRARISEQDEPGTLRRALPN
jgi:hypothetical protein